MSLVIIYILTKIFLKDTLTCKRLFRYETIYKRQVIENVCSKSKTEMHFSNEALSFEYSIKLNGSRYYTTHFFP